VTISEADDRESTFVPHRFEEHTVDLGEIRMNYAVAGDPGAPPLVLVPQQTESWWGYEDAMSELLSSFRVHAVDLRGQGRSTWTPGRYTLDVMGGDLVRFLDLVVASPAIVAGNSSGGVLAAWLGAYAKPGQVRGAVLEDAAVFSSEVSPAFGQPIRQTLGPVLDLRHTWLGDQWGVGDWQGLQEALGRELPPWTVMAQEGMVGRTPADASPSPDPPQNMREYDPGWAQAFSSGYATAGCDNERMLAAMRVPVLFTHHFRAVHEPSSIVVGAVSDQQVQQAGRLVESAGQPFTYASFPTMVHAMHRRDPALYARTLLAWAGTLPQRGGV